MRSSSSAGSDLSKPHAIEHHFICRDHATADAVTKWSAEQGFAVSKLTHRKWKGQEGLSLDLVQKLVPTSENVSSETTTMLKISRKSGAHNDGWGAAVVR
jgi:regulator of RNase E activity RraB